MATEATYNNNRDLLMSSFATNNPIMEMREIMQRPASPRKSFSKHQMMQRKNYLKINKEELKNIKPLRNSTNKSPEKNSKEIKQGQITARQRSES